jgi:hypothetical protein
MKIAREISWPRIFAEGTAIVISILLAFGIQAWWDDRGDRAEEIRLLEALRDELVRNDLEVTAALQAHRAVAEASKSLIQAYADQQELSDGELDKALGSLAFGHRTLFQGGVATGLVQSGKLSIIQDESLRNQIASILDEQFRVGRTEDSQSQTFNFALMPFLRNNGSLPQLSNAQPQNPGTGDYTQPLLPTRQSRSHQQVLESEEFVGIVTQVYWDQNDSITSLSKYQAFANELAAKIDTTLAQMDR